jgi:hypothetical protein
MVGAILLGDTRVAAAATKAIEKRSNFSNISNKPLTMSTILEKLSARIPFE